MRKSLGRNFCDLSFDPRRWLLRKFQFESVEQNGLVGFRLRVARHHQPASVGSGQTHIQHLQGGQLFQNCFRSEARSQSLQTILQSGQQTVSQKSNKNVSFDAMAQLMINRANA